MARKLLLLNLVLLAVIVVIAQRVVTAWEVGRASEGGAIVVETPSTPDGPEIPAVLARAEPLSQYLVISEKNLFSPDRGSVDESAEAAEEPAPEFPQEPKLVGVWAIGDNRTGVMRVFKSKRDKGSRTTVNVGDDVQGYTVSKIEESSLTLTWKEKNLTFPLEREASGKPKQVARASQAVNIITIGSAIAAVETVAASAEEQARGLEVGVVANTRGRQGGAGARGRGGLGQQGAGGVSGRGNQTGGLGNSRSGTGTLGTGSARRPTQPRPPR